MIAIRTARREFQCSYCRGEIAKGAQYEHRTGDLRNHIGCTKPERKHLPYYRVADMPNGKRAHVRLYQVWRNMIRRCHNPKYVDYYHYGARGISVCEEWRKSYDAFRAWAIAAGYRKGLTLDRYPEQNGNYGPSNCRWATREEQTYNSSRVYSLTFNGVTKLMPIWARELGFTPGQFRSRKKSGWTDEQILTTPWGKHREGVEHQKRGRKPKTREQFQ